MSEQKKKKNVGCVFDLLLGKGPSDTKADLIRAATESVYCENAVWQTYRLYDPVTAAEFARIRNVVREAKARQDELRKKDPKATVPEAKWPKLPEFKLSDIPEGASPTKIAKALAPSLSSCVYDAIANHCFKLYMKQRFELLSFRRRLPVSDDLRIRFREKAIKIQRDDRNPEWFKIEIKLFMEPKAHRLVIPIGARGASPFTIRWLGECADDGIHPSGGMISARRKKGKLVWQISLSRSRYEGELETVKMPIAGRVLDIEAPVDQEVFLKCSVDTGGKRPWGFPIEGHDLLQTKIGAEIRRQRMGRNYAQSPMNSAHGHGRNNVLRSKRPFSEQYRNRVTNWIENRTAFIVAEAVKMKCERIRMEDLVSRDSKTMLLGSFDYSRFTLRLQQKAKAAGIDFDKPWSRAEVKEAIASCGTSDYPFTARMDSTVNSDTWTETRGSCARRSKT